jgi:hypothetical protein
MPPFEPAALDHGRSRKQAVAGNLRFAADVDQGRTAALMLEGFGGLQPDQLGTSRLEKRVD